MEDSQKIIDIGPLISTRNFLAEIIQSAKSDYEKTGVIQVFEVGYDLVQNTARRVLNLRNFPVGEDPRAVFGLAEVAGLISNVGVWIEFTKKRNHNSHTYNSKKVNDILASLPTFLYELDLLIENLEKIPECCNLDPDITSN